MKEKTITIAGITGRGPNKTAAQADAMAKIEAAYEEGFTPYLVTHPHYTLKAFVFRCGIDSWTYSVLDYATSADPINSHIPPHSHWVRSRKTAIEDARLSLAQRCCVVHDDDRSGMEFLVDDDNAARDHLRWIAWQRSFAGWVASGVNRDMAHDKAQMDMTLVADLAARFFPKPEVKEAA